jgi:hypothetical protein
LRKSSGSKNREAANVHASQTGWGALTTHLTEVLQNSWAKDQKVIDVKIRTTHGNRVNGFVKTRDERQGEDYLFDFSATREAQGIVSSLEVDGIPIGLSRDPTKNLKKRLVHA